VETTKLAQDFGVELVDIDLAAPLAPDDRAELKHLFDTEHLLLARRQALTPEQFVDFVGCLGTLRRPNADGTRHAYISNARPDGLSGKGRLPFHSDAAFFSRPVWGLALQAEQVSASAPPTRFVSGVGAYARLPQRMKDRLEGLEAVHLCDLSDEDADRRYREAEIAPDVLEGLARAVHPAVLRDRPALGPVLFVGELHTSHFVGLEAEESDALLAELFGYLYEPETMFEHQWNEGDLVVWNNVALQHGRPEDPGEVAPRTLRRAILTGP
jgi:taurine dioxygenase